MCVRACVRACSCSLRLMLVVKFSRLGCDSAPPRYRTQRRGCRGPAKQDTIADRGLLDRPREATHIALACIFFGPAGDMAVSAQPRVSRPQPNKTALAHSRLCQRRHLAAIWPRNTPLQHEMMQVRGRFKGLRAHTHTHTHIRLRCLPGCTPHSSHSLVQFIVRISRKPHLPDGKCAQPPEMKGPALPRKTSVFIPSMTTIIECVVLRQGLFDRLCAPP